MDNEELEFESGEEDGGTLELLMSECSPQISLNALRGIPTFNTMRMKAGVQKHVLHSLVDTGSTQIF